MAQYRSVSVKNFKMRRFRLRNLGTSESNPTFPGACWVERSETQPCILRQVVDCIDLWQS